MDVKACRVQTYRLSPLRQLMGMIRIKVNTTVRKNPVRAYAVKKLKEPVTAEGLWLDVAHQFKILQLDQSIEDKWVLLSASKSK